MMKRKYIFLVFIIYPFFNFAQSSGSGIITFTTSDDQHYPIYLYIYNIVNPNGYRYLSGNTNEPIAFSGWEVDGTLSINDNNFDKNKVTIFGNPNDKLHAKILTNGTNDIIAKVLDLNGRIISKPKISYSGNYAIIEDPLANISQGMYIVQLNGSVNHSFKFIKCNSSYASVNSNINYDKSNKIEEKKTKQAFANENYKIFWSSNFVIDGSQEIQVLPINNNEIIINTNLAYLSAESGDVAINPYLKGLPKAYNRIKLTNTIVSDSTYSINTEQKTQGIFWNVYVPNDHNPVQYKVEIEDDLPDGTYLPTTTYIEVYQDDEGELNDVKQVNLNEIPNQQNITMVVRDFETLEKLQGVTVELYDSDDDSLLDSKVSDINGEVQFINIPGETTVYTKNYKTGYYKKTNKGYSLPKVDHISEMDTLLNVLAVKKFNYWDGLQVTADTINMYRPLSLNTEFILGHWRVYFPDSPNHQKYIDHFYDVANYFGFPGGIIAYDTPFTEPTPEMISNYNPYPINRQVYGGQIGSNITDYIGTQTGNLEIVLPNGNKVAISTWSWELGGLDWARTDHEVGNAMGFPLLNSTTYFRTSRDPTSTESFPFVESKQDTAIMGFWLHLGQLHYDMLDAQGRLIEYSWVPLHPFGE